MFETIISSPFFGITLSITAYALGNFLHKKTHNALCNPLLISYIIIIPTLLIFNIPLSAYNKGGDIINMFLSPITAILAITIYRQKALVKQNFLPILLGTLAGSISSLLIIILSCRLFNLDKVIEASLLAKSITTPLALSVSTSLNGIEAITIFAVVITGVFGNIIAPLLIKLFRFSNPIVQGVAIGTASHAVGTSKALELGETQGAISSISLTFAGIITVLIVLFF